MGKDEVYNYIKERTEGITDSQLEQVKISASQIIQDLKENEQTIFHTLKKLKEEKDSDLRSEKFKCQRTKQGKKIIYYEKYWWIE